MMSLLIDFPPLPAQHESALFFSWAVAANIIASEHRRSELIVAGSRGIYSAPLQLIRNHERKIYMVSLSYMIERIETGMPRGRLRERSLS